MKKKTNIQMLKYSVFPLIVFVVSVYITSKFRIYFFIYIVNISATMFFAMFFFFGVMPRILTSLYNSAIEMDTYYYRSVAKSLKTIDFLIIEDENRRG